MATTDDELATLERENETLRAARDELTRPDVEAEAERVREAKKEQLLREQAALKAEVEWAASAKAGEVVSLDGETKVAETKVPAEKAVAAAKDVASTTAVTAKATGEGK